MAPFSKPETVLKQAEGLVSVGQTHAALQSLSEMFSSKRFRSTPLASLEPIMLRFMELCVELRKGRAAKEGLMQYKNIAQNTSVGSIEVVVGRFIEMAEAKVREAQSKASASTTVGVDVDDLEASETPESILLGAVSVDQSKDRTDRALVTPWLKFLWEAYRTSLETLKNNARLEAIYQATAQGAFRFCLAHTRRVEFRRLCDTLRLHLANVGKYAHQPHSINLSDADTLQHHLDTRFAQLGAAVEMELWQEAFRSVEDVHNLLTMAKKAPRPAMMAGYYDKLGKIFLMSGNALYHAAAVGRYYALVVGGALGPKGLSGQEMGELAGKVLISALAVPAHSVGDGSGGGSASTRLTALLGLTKPPTRASLLKDALSRDVLRLAPEPVKKLYHALEVDFSPLGLCGVVAPILGELGQGTGEYKGYLPLLHHALLSRLLGHLAQVYESIKIAYLRELVEPLEAVGSQLEAYVMLLARRGQLDVRVDHAQGCIWFLDEPFASREEEGQDAGTSDSVDAIQPSATTLVQTRLNSVAGCLYSALGMIDANPPSSAQGEEESRFRSLLATLPAYRRSLLLHNSLTARRRQLAQELAARAQAQNLTLQAEVARKAALEQTRLSLLEASQREARRRQDEVERVRRQEAEKYARGLVEGGVLGKEVVEKLTASTTGPIDTTSLIQAQVLALEKSKASFSSRLKTISKRIDHLERAYRVSELKLLNGDWERQSTLDLEEFTRRQKQNKEEARERWEQEREEKRRLGRMYTNVGAGTPEGVNGANGTTNGDAQKSHWELRRDTLLKRKGEEFALRHAKAQKRMETEKAKRREEVSKRIAARKADDAAEAQRLLAEAQAKEREEREAREREEEERREAEEQERKEEEEREAKEKEEREKKEREEEERRKVREEREEERKKAVEMAQLQAKREEEALERRRLAKLGGGTAPAPERAADVPGSNVWRRPGVGATASPASSVPATPTRASAFGSAASGPTRSESPTPASSGPKFRVGAGGGWRAKEEAKARGEAPPASAPTAPTADDTVRSESPAPGAAGKYRPGALGGAGGGGWRAKEEARAKGEATPSAVDSGSAFGTSMRRTDSGSGFARRTGTESPPVSAPKKESAQDDDGFITVSKGRGDGERGGASAGGGGVWRPRRGGAAGGGR